MFTQNYSNIENIHHIYSYTAYSMSKCSIICLIMHLPINLTCLTGVECSMQYNRLLEIKNSIPHSYCNNGYISLNCTDQWGTSLPPTGLMWTQGVVYYGETTSSTLRSRTAALVRRIYRVSFSLTHLFIATWYNVGYYSRHTNRVINSYWRIYHVSPFKSCKEIFASLQKEVFQPSRCSF